MNKEDNLDLISAARFMDAVINMRNAIKQHFLQKIRHSELQDLTYEMFQVLAVLWKNKQMNQQDIANAIQKNKASMTPLIDNLCKRGLVSRMEDVNDRRNKIILLTEKGMQYQQIFRPMEDNFYKLLLSAISSKDLGFQANLLNRLANKAVTD
ncbi:transcriptional regulator, MarR family [bacterium A37T11]|nr:transcriptional regulator, MarR family [bacterium A37T11]